jgi:hypothetical protein
MLRCESRSYRTQQGSDLNRFQGPYADALHPRPLEFRDVTERLSVFASHMKVGTFCEPASSRGETRFKPTTCMMRPGKTLAFDNERAKING